MTPKTLSGQLLAWVLGALVLVWAGFVVGYRTGAEEAVELTDGQRASIAELTLGDHGSGGRYVDEYAHSVSVVVWDAAGTLLERRGVAPVGFAILQLGSAARGYQTFSRWSAAGVGRKVTVLIDTRLRDELAWDIAGDVAEPGL